MGHSGRIFKRVSDGRMPLGEIYRCVNKLQVDERTFASNIPGADSRIAEQMHSFLLRQAAILKRHLDSYKHYNFSNGTRENYVAALRLTEGLILSLQEDSEMIAGL